MINYLSALPGALAQGLIWGVMAIGVFITYKILDLADLTVDGSICTGAAVCTMLMIAGWNPWAAMFVALIAGIISGIVTGVLHVSLGIPAILAGIITQMILWSVNLKIMGKANQPLSARTYPVVVTQMSIPKSILVLVIFVAALIAVLYWFFGTEFGCGVRATGSNPIMSRAQGINTDVAKVTGLAISNGVVALSGALLAQYQGFSDINMGRGAVVTGLAAVVIGGAIAKAVSQNFAVQLALTALGAVIYFLVYQTVIFIGIDTDLLKMLSALVVAVFLGVPYVKNQIALKTRRAKGGSKC